MDRVDFLIVFPCPTVTPRLKSFDRQIKNGGKILRYVAIREIPIRFPMFRNQRFRNSK